MMGRLSCPLLASQEASSSNKVRHSWIRNYQTDPANNEEPATPVDKEDNSSTDGSKSTNLLDDSDATDPGEEEDQVEVNLLPPSQRRGHDSDVEDDLAFSEQQGY